MIGKLALGLSAALAVTAAPTSVDIDINLSDLVLMPLEDGTHQIMNYSTWLDTLVANGVSLTVPEIDYDFLNFTVDEDALARSRKRQDCDSTTSVVTDKTENFVDWDVQMSNVVCANAGNMDIFVASGYSVANTVTVSAGLDYTFIADKLKGSLGVDFSRTWTTTTSVQNKGTVENGNCGVMITKPLTTRRYGRALEGCIGSLVETGTWTADDRGTGSYNGVSWIAGAVSMCSKPGSNPPLSRCNGEGNFS